MEIIWSTPINGDLKHAWRKEIREGKFSYWPLCKRVDLRFDEKMLKSGELKCPKCEAAISLLLQLTIFSTFNTKMGM